MLISQRPSLSEEILTDSRSQFVIEPLEPGFGYTLGNSLRRTLLSSIPGAAVTSIRIDGVLHEFTTVPGVKQDARARALTRRHPTPPAPAGVGQCRAGSRSRSPCTCASRVRAR